MFSTCQLWCAALISGSSPNSAVLSVIHSSSSVAAVPPGPHARLQPIAVRGWAGVRGGMGVPRGYPADHQQHAAVAQHSVQAVPPQRLAWKVSSATTCFCWNLARQYSLQSLLVMAECVTHIAWLRHLCSTAVARPTSMCSHLLPNVINALEARQAFTAGGLCLPCRMCVLGQG